MVRNRLWDNILTFHSILLYYCLHGSFVSVYILIEINTRDVKVVVTFQVG